jgi:hypothetical protein
MSGFFVAFPAPVGILSGMQIINPAIEPPSVLDPGSCQAVRIAAILDKPINRVEVTPEWLAENARKQEAYERQRAEWRVAHPQKNTNT